MNYRRYEYYKISKLISCLEDVAFNSRLEPYIATALNKIPINIANKVIKKCFFATLENRASAQYFSANIIKKRAIIIIDNRFLKRATPEAIEFTILHEIAHWFLKHSHIFPKEISEKEIRKIHKKSEDDASNLVDEWLTQWRYSCPAKTERDQWNGKNWVSRVEFGSNPNIKVEWKSEKRQ